MPDAAPVVTHPPADRRSPSTTRAGSVTRLDVRVERRPDPVVVLRGELDLSTAGRLEAVVDGLVAAGEPVVLDLGGVTFVDSRGLLVLVRAARACGGVVRLATSSPHVDRLLAVTGAGRLFAR